MAFAISIDSDRSALAPPSAMKPSGGIFYDKTNNTCRLEIYPDNIRDYEKAQFRIEERELEIIEEYLKEHFGSTREDAIRDALKGRIPGGAFRNRWVSGEIASLIGQMLVITRDNDIKNPKAFLIPLLKEYMEKRDGMAEIRLEGYDIDGIEDVWEDEEIKAFMIPIRRGDAAAFWMRYYIAPAGDKESDTVLTLGDGTRVRWDIEAAPQTGPEEWAEVANFQHDLRNLIEGLFGGTDTLIQKSHGELAQDARQIENSALKITPIILAILNSRPTETKNIDSLRIAAAELATLLSPEKIAILTQEYINIEKIGGIPDNEASRYGRNFSDICNAIKLILGSDAGLNIDGSVSLAEKIGGHFKASCNVTITDILKKQHFAGNGSEIFRVLLNLMRNAREAFGHATGAKTVIVNIVADGNMAKIEISDTGGGMPEDKVAAFNRGEPVGSDRGLGRGLGLGIVQSLVQKNGGTVEVRSKIGVGTTFILRLPIASQFSAKKENPASSLRA